MLSKQEILFPNYENFYTLACFPLTVILQVGEVQDLGPDLQRETFMLSHPRATSPIDFSIHALEILTREGYDCPHSNSLCVQRRTEKQ